MVGLCVEPRALLNERQHMILSKKAIASARWIDWKLFNGALLRGFRIYGVNGSHRRGKSSLDLGRVPAVAKSLLRERSVEASEFIRKSETRLFLGGTTGRAGTTWVQDLLREYAPATEVYRELGVFMLGAFRNAPYELFQVANKPEGFRQYMEYFRTNATRTLFNTRRAVTGIGLDGISGVMSRRGLNMALDSLEERLTHARELDDFYRCFGEFYTWIFNFNAVVASGNTRWVSKEPPYGRHMDDLFRMLPDAKLLVLARDGRSTALSMCHLGWHESVRTAFARWAEFTERTLDHMEKAPEGQVMLLRFEDLVTDFDKNVRSLFAFFGLGEPPVNDMLADSLLKPDVSILEKWRTRMQADDLEYFDQHYGHVMERLGYDGF